MELCQLQNLQKLILSNNQLNHICKIEIEQLPNIELLVTLENLFTNTVK